MLTIGVHASDLRAWMQRDHGLEVTRQRLHHATANGWIPQPCTTVAGDHIWRPEDLQAVIEYFKNPRRPGRPRKAS